MTKNPKPNQHLLNLKPFTGGEKHAAQGEGCIRLSFNEGALGASPLAIEAFQNSICNLSIYPDMGYKNLRTAIAEHMNCDPLHIVCGAGSDELIGLITRAYAAAGDEVLQSEYGFAMFPIAARSVGAKPVLAKEENFHCDVDAFLSCVTEKTKVVFIANPNNPTGSYIPYSEIERLHKGLPQNVLLVLDSAYCEYMDQPDYSCGRKLVENFDNVIMTRTFSKIYALGGLRIGWVYCPAHVADTLNRVRSPFNVSVAAEAAAIASLKDTAFVEKSRLHTKQWREWLDAQLTKLGFLVRSSVTNFLLVEIGSPDRAESLNHFLASRNIFVRPMAGYGLPSHLRITIGTEAQMKILVQTISDYLDQEQKIQN